MTPTVSVVIPVYNSEVYLPMCIASLQAQTLSDCEFLFVDDGSTDGSCRVIEEAARQDSRIRLIALPRNCGVSAARNRGIDEARGTYLGFCDADDFMETQMLETLVRACREKRAQAAFCRVFKDRGQMSLNVPLNLPKDVYSGNEIREELVPEMLALQRDGDAQPLSGYSPRNLFLRERVHVRYREDIHYAEDLLFIVGVLLTCDRVAAVDEALYHYRFHAGSTTKHYSPYLPLSQDLSNDALQTLLAGSAICQARMKIRRRRTAVEAVRNFCAPGTPLSLPKRMGAIRSYLGTPQVRESFQDLKLREVPLRTGVRLCLCKYRLSLLCTLLYSTVFRTRV